MLHIQQNIRLVRLFSDKTQEEFGKMFGATPSMIKSYEAGRAKPDELFVSRVSKKFSISVDDLLNKPLTEDDLVQKGENVQEAEPYYINRTSLERSIENLTENELRTTAVIERLVSILEFNLMGGKKDHHVFADPGLNQGGEGFAKPSGKSKKS